MNQMLSLLIGGDPRRFIPAFPESIFRPNVWVDH